MAAAVGCRCSPAATSGKDAAREPPPPPHMTSPAPSQFGGRSRREKNKPEQLEPAGFLLAPVRLFPSVSSIPTRRFLRRDEVAPLTSPGPPHPGQPAEREGEDCRLSMPILRHTLRQQGTIPKTRRSSMSSGDPGLFCWRWARTLASHVTRHGIPVGDSPPAMIGKKKSDMAFRTRQRQQQ